MDLYIFGSGDLARELYALVEDINGADNNLHNICGFLSPEKASSLEIGDKSIPVFLESEILGKDDNKNNFAIGIGNPKILKKISTKYNHLNFPNIIHPNVVGHWQSVKMGKGNVITAGNIFTTNIKIGSFNYFNLACTHGHDNIYGDNNIINPGCNISGKVEIGSCCLLGTNATILQGIKVGDNVTLGAAALANKDLEEGHVYIGIPAKPLKKS